jgi:hypothetical protein
MLDIIKSTQNGNGSDVISGRGLRRRKLTSLERIGLAADLATGQRQLTPSLTQSADLTEVPLRQLRKELKARVAGVPAEEELNRWRVQLKAERVNAQATAIAAAWFVGSESAREVALHLIWPGNLKWAENEVA